LQHKACAEGIERGPKGTRSPGRQFPFVRTFFPVNGEAMSGYRKASSNVMVRADKLSEPIIFWALVSTAIVISLAMMKGVLLGSF